MCAELGQQDVCHLGEDRMGPMENGSNAADSPAGTGGRQTFTLRPNRSAFTFVCELLPMAAFALMYLPHLSGRIFWITPGVLAFLALVAAFFAPEIEISPWRGRPPSIS